MPDLNPLLSRFSDAFRELGEHIVFSILEIGALPLGGAPEPFYVLLDLFPGSRVTAFEVDDDLCAKLNAEARPGVHYVSAALGKTTEVRTFYETVAPMCGSLYPPNEELLQFYNNLEVAYLKETSEIHTTSLDAFMKAEGLPSIDFVKIDVQGAELEIFQGGVETLKHAVAIVSEVEFIPLYHGQPLFGDVSAYLAEQGLMFQKFLGIAGRTVRPLLRGGSGNFPSQNMWADAVFVTDIRQLPKLRPQKLLKLAVLACVYDSQDFAYACLSRYDAAYGTNLRSLIFG